MVLACYNSLYFIFVNFPVFSRNIILSGKEIMHDPFAMRPFFGYNFGDYCKHWLSMESKPGVKLPKIFHVNWFRKDDNNKFMWPGFGENARVLEWIMRRVDGEECAEKSAIGYLPKENSINTEGLGKIDMNALNHLPKDFWTNECTEIKKYFNQQVGADLPEAVLQELASLEKRVATMS